MGLDTKKKELIQRIKDVDNESIINSIEQLLDSDNQPVAYTIAGKPLDKEAFIAAILSATDSAKAGNFTTQEDLEKEIENW